MSSNWVAIRREDSGGENMGFVEIVVNDTCSVPFDPVSYLSKFMSPSAEGFIELLSIM